MSPAIAAETETVWLVNISPEEWPPRNRTYLGSLEVRSPQAGEVYAVTPIRGCKGFIDMGDRRTVDYRLTAKEVADDIAREINGDSGEGSFHGVFVSAEARPSDGALAEARRKLQEFQRRLVSATPGMRTK
ncbi:MAG TPA: hypothetical protein VN037_12605 [Verrucomicrobiae bacterium]|nr:hypothetical protein [Verrucomicrobiae bacterium]